MNHAMPARLTLSTVSAVSRAPHSLPLAYITCCMRVSLESGREMTSLCAGGRPNRRRQQPVPAIVTVVMSLMQSPSGVSIVASVPEPGCFCFGGTPYWFDESTLLLRVSAGVLLFSDEVFVSAHTMSWLEVWLPPAPATGFVASSAAL